MYAREGKKMKWGKKKLFKLRAAAYSGDPAAALGGFFRSGHLFGRHNLVPLLVRRRLSSGSTWNKQQQQKIIVKTDKPRREGARVVRDRTLSAAAAAPRLSPDLAGNSGSSFSFPLDET